ncbi:MAG: sugar kinase [Acidobacteriota bacterium]|nr:sugar kinase [Acidobacteriota bacterium]
MKFFNHKTPENYRWDLVSFGEVLLRFDPEKERIHTTRSFLVFDGGAEYNVARNLAKVFRRKTAIVTALADNALGRLAEDFVFQAGVDGSEIIWRGEDSETRNGIYFIERGFGLRAPASCFDRANTAVSQIKTGEIKWREIFDKNGTRWFHTGGVFTGLSANTPRVAIEAMQAARASGAIVSYDLNYRDSLWKNKGGREAANAVNRELLPFVDVVFGVMDFDARLSEFDAGFFRQAAEKMLSEFADLKIVCSTLREVHSASRHDLGAVCFAEGEVFKAKNYQNIEVLDRVGSGDAFASGLIYGLLAEKDFQYAVECGAAHAALSMTTPGDNSMSTMTEIENLMQGADGNVKR